MVPEELLTPAIAAARAAGERLRERFRGRLEIATKSTPTDMVTDADRAAEQAVLDVIRRARPDDSILAEEGGASPGSSGVRWVVDPLDGTTNFLYGIEHWAVSVCAEDAFGPLAGVVYDPNRDELFAAARGEGATLNGTTIAASGLQDVSRALVATGFSYRPTEREFSARLFTHVLPRVRDVRRFGAAALDLAWVAAGRYDAYAETPIEWWDVAAGSLIVREAGGRFGPLPSPRAQSTGWMAASAGVYEPLRALLDEAFAAAAKHASP